MGDPGRPRDDAARGARRPAADRPPALGHYVYCVVPAGEVPPLAGVQGVDPRFGVAPVTHRDVAALTSRVGLDEFGADALRRNLEDLAWVERTARAHDAVLARALAAEAVVPLRLCTIFTDAAKVRAMLAREHEPLTRALRRLRGCAEWSVKVRATRRRDAAAARDRPPAPARAPGDPPEARAGAPPPEGSGRAFFARKQTERARAEDAHARAIAAAETIDRRLRAEATGATLLPPQDPALSRRPGTMVLNGAYLVAWRRAPEFRAAVAELTADHRATGVEIDVSGPWAPYTFVAPPEPRHERRVPAPDDRT